MKHLLFEESKGEKVSISGLKIIITMIMSSPYIDLILKRYLKSALLIKTYKAGLQTEYLDNCMP